MHLSFLKTPTDLSGIEASYMNTVEKYQHTPSLNQKNTSTVEMTTISSRVNHIKTAIRKQISHHDQQTANKHQQNNAGL